VEVEPWVLPAGAGAEVGEKPTTDAGAGADAASDASEAGGWGHDATQFGASREHYWMELPQPSSSLSPYGRGSHCP
jgi:hypothetical protein